MFSSLLLCQILLTTIPSKLCSPAGAAVFPLPFVAPAVRLSATSNSCSYLLLALGSIGRARGVLNAFGFLDWTGECGGVMPEPDATEDAIELLRTHAGRGGTVRVAGTVAAGGAGARGPRPRSIDSKSDPGSGRPCRRGGVGGPDGREGDDEVEFGPLGGSDVTPYP